MLIDISGNIYAGRTPPEHYEQLIAFLDEVFFRDDDPETKRDFMSLLPKLYQPRYDPCYNNFCVMEGDTVKAAVGLYYNTVSAGGEALRCGGIGNVAVARDARSKGYMINCMNQALDDMIASKTDFGLLGGQRQRYGYFSFEPAGLQYSFGFNLSNIRHCFGSDAENILDVREIAPQDTQTLEAVERLLRSESCYAPHQPDELYDILCSWRSRPFAAFKGEAFRGFFTVGREGGLGDFKAVDADACKEMVLAVFETVQNPQLGFTVAPFDKTGLDFFTVTAENCSLRHSECYTVLCFERVLRAFLKVKAALEPLCDGEASFLIHGRAGDENLAVSVKAGVPEVAKSQGPAAFELGHHEAMRAFISLSSAERRTFPPQIAQWFPLPMFTYHFDSV